MDIRPEVRCGMNGCGLR